MVQGVKTVKYILFILIVILLISLISGCNNIIKEKNDKELTIFAEAFVDGNVISNSENYILFKVNKIVSYNSKQNLELLDEEDAIKIFISIINSKDKINPSTYIKNFSGEIRCLDGRVNSLETFNKDSCYWEASEDEI